MIQFFFGNRDPAQVGAMCTELPLDKQSIAHVKFLLYCFETMFGLKINYDKSEVIIFGASKQEC
jgi:hypothetical protein